VERAYLVGIQLPGVTPEALTEQLSELAAQYQKEAEGSSRDVSTIYKTIMQMKSLNPDAYSLSINSEAKTAELTPLAQAEPSKPDPAVVPAA